MTAEVTDTVLVAPDGHVIEHLALQRLRRLLAAADDASTAVIAPLSVPVSGGSYRTHAEWSAIEGDPERRLDDGPVPGVAIVRRGVPFEVHGDTVVVGRGRTLVAPGAVSHDTRIPLGPLEAASPLGRSPFPRRPLVLLLGTVIDGGSALWATRMANELLELDVEGRLALADPAADEPLLFRPCTPTQQSVRALQPDVVITLDEMALTQATAWAERRSTVLVHHTGERTLAADLISWRIGDSSGRLRAVIGSAIDPPELAQLCARLCGGPLVSPPVPESADEEVAVRGPTIAARARRHRRRIAVIRPARSASDDHRLEALLAEATALGEECASFDDEDAADTIGHEVVFLSSDVDPHLGGRVIADRKALGKKTIVDVAPTDRANAALVDLCENATAANAAIQHTLEQRGIAVRRLPLLPNRAILERLRRASGDPQDEPVVVGVRADDPEPSQLAAVSAALRELWRSEDDSLRVEWVGRADQLPAPLQRDLRVQAVPVRAPEACAHWTLHLWIASGGAVQCGWPEPIVEMSYLGIPTVFPANLRGDITDDVIARWMIDDADQSTPWYDAVRAICDAPASDRTALRARGDLLFGPRACSRIVERLLGWAAREDAKR